MVQRINKTEELEKRLPYEILDKPEHKKAIENMNKSIEKVRRDFIKKDAKSKKSAKYVILTQRSLNFGGYGARNYQNMAF